MFLSPDAGRGDLTQPLSLQPYLYALQNPTGYVDPTGDIAFLNNLVGGAVSVGVGVVLSRVTGKEYTFTDALVDFGLGFGTSGLSAVAKVRQVQQLGRVGQAATRLAAETTFNVGAEAARQGFKGEENLTTRSHPGSGSQHRHWGSGSAVGAASPGTSGTSGEGRCIPDRSRRSGRDRGPGDTAGVCG